MPKNLEQMLRKKVKPLVDSAMQQHLGATIDELGEDITARISKDPLLSLQIDLSVKFKEARRRFVISYLRKLLQITYGNVSETGAIAGIDRRSVHRLIKRAVNVEQIRTEMKRAYDVKQSAISGIIEEVLGIYKSVLNPQKLDAMYRNVSQLSRHIVDQLPERYPTLKEAEEEFEKEYLKKALRAGNLSHAAKVMGLRYETVLRKAKKLGIIES